jgi:hypothetical protein
LERRYESLLRKSASSARGKYVKLRELLEADEAFRAVSAGALENFVMALKE